MPLNTALADTPDPGSRAGTISFWESKGAPRHVAEGIADRVNAESSFNAKDATGDKGTSGGLYQHHADRLARLKEFAASQGKSWTDPQLQHELAFREVQGLDSIAAAHWKEILAAPDRATASKLWDRYFERSKAGPGSGAPGGDRRMVGRFGEMGPRVPGSPVGDDEAAPADADAMKLRLDRLARALRPATDNPIAPVASDAATAAAPKAAAPLPAPGFRFSPMPIPQAPNLPSIYKTALARVLNKGGPLG